MRSFLFLMSVFFCLELSAAEAIISVTGEAEKENPADQWDLSFNLQLKEADRKSLMKVYQDSKRELFATLDKLGIKEKEVRSQNFWISPWQVWEKNVSVNKGFQLSHTFMYRIDNLELIGEALGKLALLKGIEVQGMSHQLKRSTLDKINKELYQAAFISAQSKIEAICAASGKKFKGLLSIEELSERAGGYSGRGMEKSMQALSSDAVSGGSSISLVPTMIKVQSELKVVASFIP